MDMLSMEGATQDSTTQTGGYDPLQDIGFSMEPCTKVLPDVLHIKLALLLKKKENLSILKDLSSLESVQFLKSMKMHQMLRQCSLLIKQILLLRETSSMHALPWMLYHCFQIQEEYDLSLELINEDMYNIACVNITLIGH
ncbi:lymphocyte antigen 86 isoform X3 [Rhinatrema bivittatum]|uniref:lymphocyte antigen 86 isoform X3 n=1 Tax=Rhinatrema bivittatum TaxID=194408 RepID=UPI001125C9B1|nr:lymphocyte antigen 86 isoform X3 [Rhinatrema bivittatum]XP_029446464.1 lymphocyte antigen 86 isoform X3 [Rhinatrema bivittatum]